MHFICKDGIWLLSTVRMVLNIRMKEMSGKSTVLS